MSILSIAATCSHNSPPPDLIIRRLDSDNSATYFMRITRSISASFASAASARPLYSEASFSGHFHIDGDASNVLSSVNLDFSAVDVGRTPGAKKQHGFGYLSGVTKAVHWNLGFDNLVRSRR